MTKDTSPENLRKFLESDDPALVTMGLSMAKGVGVPDEMLGKILWMYMFHDDKTIRTAAKSTFIKLAPEDAKKVVRDNWRVKYRTQSFSETFSETFPETFSDTTIKKFKNCKVGDCKVSEYTEKKFGHASVLYRGAYIHPATLLISHALIPTSISIIEPLCKELKHDVPIVRLVTAKALGMIKDKRAVEPLIKALENEDWNFRWSIIKVLRNINDKHAVEQLRRRWRSSATRLNDEPIGEKKIPDAEIDYNSMKVAELKEFLKERELPVSGTKAELIERFQNWISATETKNYMNQNPMLDWSELYGEEKGFSNRVAIEQRSDFKQEVLRTLKLRFGRRKFVQIATDLEDRRISKVGETLHRMKSGVPLILQGFLWNPDNKTYGMPDIMVRNDMLPMIPENEEYRSFFNIDTSSKLGNYHYRIIDVKFTTLNYNADGVYLLGADAYKAQLAISNQALGRIQGFLPPEAYLLGRDWKRTKNGIEIWGVNPFDRLGIVDFFNIDREFNQKANNAIDWRRKVRKEGSTWSFSDAVKNAINSYLDGCGFIYGGGNWSWRSLIKTLEHSNIKEKDNIIKFLKSKDPGMVRMGASMLKGILKE